VYAEQRRSGARYFETMAELRKYAACFHLLAAPPQALVVDDMSDFLDSRRAHQQCSVAAAGLVL
jgi:hypothetical protein